MKRIVIILRDKKLLAMAVIASLACATGVSTPLITRHNGAVLNLTGLVLFAAGLIILLCIAVRILLFYSKSQKLLRRLVSGEYESGVAVSGRWQDEFTVLEELFNKLTEQLRIYDDLRKNRIRQLRMTLDLTIQKAAEPIALFDVEKNILQCNPVMQDVLGTPKPSLSLGALKAFEVNAVFLELLDKAVHQEKNQQQGHVTIQLPGQEATREISISIVPYKDKDETVPLAVIFGIHNNA